MIKIIYMVFLAILFALFIGMGIQTFYPTPKSPEYPPELQFAKGPDSYTPEQKATQVQYDKEQKDWQKDFQNHSKYTSIIAIVISVLAMAVSLTLLAGINYVADGILLGSAFTLIYALIRGMMSGDNRFQFITVSIGLAIAIVVGYFKLSKPERVK
jgi:hypothetical protein